MSLLSLAQHHLTTHLPRLMAPTHRLLPFGLLDIIGAARLSMIVNWIASGAFDPPTAGSAGEKKAGKGKVVVTRSRATVWQEVFGLMVVVFGGETFLCMCTGTTPSWLLDPKLALLFGGIHVLQTRSPLRSLLPARPSLALELLFTLPDALNRTLLLTRFSILPLLHPTPGSSTLPPTPSSLILVPFILAVPFASISFSTFNLFSATPKFDTPAELKPGGWALADTWIPVLVPVLFLALIGPVEGWAWGVSWSEDEAFGLCFLVTWAVFVGRTIYNMGYRREQWLEMVGAGGKTKTE